MIQPRSTCVTLKSRFEGDQNLPDINRRIDQIAMLVYPQMTALDLIGPQSMFASLMGAELHLVAKSLDPVTSDSGVTITPTATFDSCPRDLTVLFTPGGTDGTLAAAMDPVTLAFMADRGHGQNTSPASARAR